MQRLHDPIAIGWKADILTLRDLGIIRQRYERIPKRKQVLEYNNNIRVSSEVSKSHSKPATSCNPIKKGNAEVSQKDEGLNVRMAKELERLWAKQ